MKKRATAPSCVLAMIGSAFLPTALLAGSFNSNFNDGLVPSNAQVFGNTVVEAAGGVNDSGVLKVTKAINSQSGSFILNDLDGGATVYGFKMSMMARVGGGTATPADGWSVCVAPDLPDATWGEGGAGNGFIVSFDTYNNSGEAPQISVKVGGTVVKSTGIIPIADMITGSQFVPVVIALDADGAFQLDFNGKTVFPKFYLPNYQPLSSVRYGIGGRTGGANENCFIDDLSIETYLKPLPGFVRQPQNMTVITGSPAQFVTQLNNSDGATIQWLRNGTVIAGATDTTYTLPAVTSADNGAKFTLKVTLGSTVVTSAEAVLKVVNIDFPTTPAVSFNFNDGTVPANTLISDTAVVNSAGGVGDSGVLMLTDAMNDQNGAFLIADPNAGAPVYGIAARFDLRMGGGTETPADGFSFNFASDLPDSGLGLQVEEGLGTGLSVTADIYDNGGGEAPSFSVKHAGAVVVDKKVLLSEMSTGDGFADVLVRLTADGLIDLAWNGNVIFDRVPVPGFTSISGGRIGLYGRTGGLNEIQAVDNLKIYTYLTADIVRISKQPAAQTVLAGKKATFTTDVNLPEGTTYQWFLNGTAIPGATQNAYATPATVAADQGGKFKVTVQRGNQTVTSDEVTLSVVDLAPPVNPQISYDFNNGIPAGAEIGGTTIVDSAGGINDSGVLKATIAINSQAGGFRSPVIEGGAQLLDINIAVDVLAGGGTTPPADGFSINIGNDLPLTASGDSENGSGTGLTFAFDTYDNGGGEAPSVDIKYKGQVVVSKKVSAALMNVADTYFPLLIHVRENGVVDLAYGDTIIYNGYPIPNYVPLSGTKVAIYARTGGANANFWFDNFRLGVKLPTAVSITAQPVDALVLAGGKATFKVQVSNPAGVAYQWMRNGVNISGATQASYTTSALALADDSSAFTVKVTAPGNSLTSSAAHVKMLASFDAGANPAISLDFNDGTAPADSAVLGNAVLEEGALKLTINENGQSSAFLLPTPAGVSPIYDFTATWKMRLGGGSDVPADGCSFVLASDLADVTFGEDGMGSGLVVSFDIYDNGGGEAPAIDIAYKSESVATVKFDISVLRTGDAFVPIGVRVNRTGTLDLFYNNTAVFRDLPLPKYTPFEEGRFGWGARTGGLNENQWMDDVKISVNTQPAVVEKPQFTGIKKNTDGTVTITWTGGGTLQVSTTVNGTYTDVAGAASPYTITPPSPVLFGRIKK